MIERERERERVCVSERERECVSERERECVCEREREREVAAGTHPALPLPSPVSCMVEG